MFRSVAIAAFGESQFLIAPHLNTFWGSTVRTQTIGHLRAHQGGWWPIVVVLISREKWSNSIISKAIESLVAYTSGPINSNLTVVRVVAVRLDNLQLTF